MPSTPAICGRPTCRTTFTPLAVNHRYCSDHCRKTAHRESLPLVCITCRDEKPDDEFARCTQRKYRRGRAPECKTCSALRRRNARAKHRTALVIEGHPTCARVGCSSSAVKTITYGTFRNWISLRPQALQELGLGVGLCDACHHTATLGNSPPGERAAPKSRPIYERLASGSRSVA